MLVGGEFLATRDTDAGRRRGATETDIGNKTSDLEAPDLVNETRGPTAVTVRVVAVGTGIGRVVVRRWRGRAVVPQFIKGPHWGRRTVRVIRNAPLDFGRHVAAR